MVVGRSLSLVFALLFVVGIAHSQVCVNIPVNITRFTIANNPKANLTDTWVLQFIGTYPTGLTKISAMQYAVQRINSQFDILPNIRLELYGQNSNGGKTATLSGTIASYNSAQGCSGFIGGETFTDTQYVQYMASSYGTPQINPSTVEAAMSSPSSYPTLLNIIPSSQDQQNAVLALLNYWGIKTALIISTNNQYGNEFNSLPYHPLAVANNITFQQISISTSLTDSAQKLALAQQYMPMYRYVICHGSTYAITQFIGTLGQAGLTGPDYLYILTHQIAVAIVEKPPSYKNQYPYLDGAIGIVARSEDDNPFANEVLNDWATNTSTSDYAGAKTNIRSSWFAFDTVYAYAYALDALTQEGTPLTGVTPENYLKKLLALNFTGVTGQVTFDPSTHSRPGPWDIVNFNYIVNTTIVTSTVNQTDPITNETVPVEVNTTKTTTAFVSNFRAVACYGCSTLYQVNSQFTFFGGNTTLPPPYIACPKDCDTCTGDGKVCTNCSTNRFLFEGLCLAQCPNLTVANTSSGQCVQACPKGCDQCSGVVCSVCSEDYFRFQGLCLAQCPNSTYTNTSTGQCVPTCQQDCAQCTPDGSACSVCFEDYYLFQGICLAQCPNSTYLNTTLGQCVPACQIGCAECTADGTACTNCSSSYFLFQGLCVSQCPNSTYANATLGQCVPVSLDQARKYRDHIPAISIALGVIIGVAVLFAVFAALMLVSFWASFSKHGSFYCALIISGVFVAYISVLVLLPAPTDTLCLAFPWFLGIGFTLVYGCLFIKTWALFMVYRSAEQLKKTKMTPMYIIARLALYILVEIIILIIWSAVDRPRSQYVKMVDNTYQLQCVTHHPTFWAIFASTKGAWLVFGSILSVLTRHVAREYNESKSIAYAIYNIIALLIIAIPLAVALKDIPGGLLIIEVGVVVIALSFTLFALFFPIWYGIFFPNKMHLDSFGMSARSTSYTSRNSVSGSRNTSNSPHESANPQTSAKSRESSRKESSQSLSERETSGKESLRESESQQE
eukprot:Phypoly_transcript_01317.p1 GENE.Phypoly_transcript_01317~~Phypoly_transcript_01317.p1  ORF type:complete len:1012 (+),score=72.69 Phypoly_transcript_01317:355-3390(+)